MQLWHFTMSGEVRIEGNEKPLYIREENISTLIRISDYRKKNMPQMSMKLNLDKNLIDLIVSNAKTCTIHLKISKFDKQSDDEDPSQRNLITYIEDDFSVFVDNDINYNKEVDYKESTALPNEKERTDIWNQLNIGLISKSCIDANKVASNVVFYQTNISNMVGFFLQSLHPLIEPFVYNPQIEQLIIPPQETLVKTIKFLNETKVFYDTNYLFFIDEPSCTYLISRSGKPVERKDEIYPDVCFVIHPKDDLEMATPGMMVDDENQRYYADINVADTRYSIDHDLAKIYDKIEEIINPDIKNTTSTLQGIQDIFKEVQNVVNSVKSVAESVQNQIQDLPNVLSTCATQMRGSIEGILDPQFVPGWNKDPGVKKNYVDVYAKCTEAINILQDIPVSVVVDSTTYNVLPNKTRYINNLTNFRDQVRNNYKSVQNLNRNFQTLTTKTEDVGYKIQTIPNHLSCFSTINAQDGAKATNKAIKILSAATTEMNTLADQVQSNRSVLSTMKTNYNGILTQISNAINEIKSSKAPSGSIPSSLSTLESIYKQLNEEVKPSLLTELSDITGYLNKYKGIPTILQRASTDLNGLSSDLTRLPVQNLKKKITGIYTDIRTLGQTAEKALDKIKNIGKGIQEGFSFDINTFKDLGENLNSIADLTGIGKSGKSFFDTALKVGQDVSDKIKKGVKILKTVNDNANKIKCIKSEMETMMNKISLNKFDMDPSVFTPNKKYLIKNYNGHANKDGLFILNKKVEVFIREDNTTFLCNTMLDFAKLSDEVNKDTKVNDTQKTDNETGTTNQSVDKVPSVIPGIGGVTDIKTQTQARPVEVQFPVPSPTLGSISINDLLHKIGF